MAPKTYEDWFKGLTYEQQLLVNRILGDAGTLKLEEAKIKTLLQEEVKSEVKEEARQEKREDSRREERRDGERGEKPSNAPPASPNVPSTGVPPAQPKTK